jgi:hypothetical protein
VVGRSDIVSSPAGPDGRTMDDSTYRRGSVAGRAE